jgi:alpha-L-rhamnosidase
MRSKVIMLAAILSSLLVPGGLSTQSNAAVLPHHLKCEYRSNPLGIDLLNPRLSWQMTSGENGELQTAYRILVSSSQELLKSNVGDVWDTKQVTSSQSINIPYNGSPLRSGQKYFWKIMVWGKSRTPSDWSAPAFWSTGLLDGKEWKAKWIGLDRLVGGDDTSEYTRLSARYLRKDFEIGKEIQSATVYISGLGLYELSVNGKKVGDAVLAPAQTQFNKRILYNTYDVTPYLANGANALGVILGNGRYFMMRKSSAAHFGLPRLLLQMDITFRDGSTQRVVSDESWKITADGPITENSEYDGEKYDARKEMMGWSEAGFNDNAWMNVELLANPTAQIRAQLSEPIRITETIKPVSVKKIQEGKYIFDVGQNMVGWVHLTVKQEPGTRVRMRFAESLSGDSLYLANIRGAKVTDEYVCKGSGVEQWQPRFTYHGFRYVEMTGIHGEPDLATIEGKVVHDDVTRIGTFTSSNDNMNRVFRNAVWGIRGNYRSFPTDCPQRDERQGWLGDRAMGSRGESFVFDISTLYGKWIRDICDAQRKDGSIPDVCPAYWNLYSDNITWDGTPVVLLGMLRTQYADLEIVREAYPSMKKWHDYMTKKYLRKGLMPRDTYGDWCVPPDEPEAIHTGNLEKVTSGSYIGSAYFYYLTTNMKQFARLLGKKTDEQYFARQAEAMKKAFNTAYFNAKTRTYSNNSGTANILALAFNLVERKNQSTVADNLVERVETLFRGHIPTGLVGAQFLMRTLTQIGRADLALRFATQTDYPSWGYMVRNNATTIWELWNGNTADPAMNSQNHVMLLGDLLTWYYENLAGIKSSETETGFKRLVMEPALIAGLDSVDASYVSPYGPISSKWTVEGKTFTWDISVPVNSTATICVPAGQQGDVFENGKPVSASTDCKVVGMKNGKLIVEIPSGHYRFSSSGFSVVTSPRLVAAPRFENKRRSDTKSVPILLACNTEGAAIHYTLDNTAPTEKSPLYDGTLEVGKSAVVRAKAFKEGFIDSYESKAEIEIHPERIPVQTITYVTRYSPKHLPANGDTVLIDQQEASMSYGDGKWAGYEGDDMEVILDIGKPIAIHRLIIRCLSQPNSWIFLPASIAIATSSTAGKYSPATTLRCGPPRDVQTIQKYAIPMKAVKAQYVKVKVKNIGKCPPWHPAPGEKAWLFVDEIFVE